MLFWVLPIAQVDVPLGIASIIPGPSWGTSSEGGSVLSVSEMDSSGRISSAGGSSGAGSSVGVVSSVVGELFLLSHLSVYPFPACPLPQQTHRGSGRNTAPAPTPDTAAFAHWFSWSPLLFYFEIGYFAGLGGHNVVQLIVPGEIILEGQNHIAKDD